MNKQLDLLLIRLVKATPILYDKTKFSDYNEREVAWQKIGDKLHRPAVECRERWMSMREFFRSTTLKLSRANSTGQPIKKKPYKYHNELLFLMAHYKHCKNGIENFDNKIDDSTNLANDDEDDLITFDIDGPDIPDTITDVEGLKDNNDIDSNHKQDDIINGVDEFKDDDDSDTKEDNAEINNFSDNSIGDIEEDFETTESKPKSNTRKRKIAVNDSSKKSVRALNKIVELNPSNATDCFLINIRAKMKGMSRSKVDKVKSKIYSIMSQYE